MAMPNGDMKEASNSVSNTPFATPAAVADDHTSSLSVGAALVQYIRSAVAAKDRISCPAGKKATCVDARGSLALNRINRRSVSAFVLDTHARPAK